jgi:ribose transport system ATP-binding protein
VNELYPSSERVPGEPILKLDALCGRRLPRDASLDLHRGEILGIGGLVGSGRSEMLRALFGLEPIVSGRVRIAIASGKELREDTRATPAKRLRQGIGLLSEDRKVEGLALRLPVAINATLSHFVRGRGMSRFGVFRRSQLARDTSRLCEQLSIRSAGPWQPTWSLSGGNQQKVALARLLHHDCDVLLLDEPTRGVDVGSKAQLYHLLDEAASRGIAILAICSYIPELLGICDRVAVMHRGCLGPARPAEDWTEHAVLEEALVGSVEGGVA